MPRKPKWLTEWEQAVLKSRALVKGPGSLSANTQLYLDEVMAEALAQISSILDRIPGDTLRAERAEAVARQIRRILDGQRQALDTHLGDSITKVVDGVVSSHELGVSAALKAAGVNVAYDFSRVPQRALELMAIRRGLGISETWRSLNAKAYGQTFLGVDRFLASQVALGVPAETVKRRLAYMMASKADGSLDEGLMRALGTRGVTGRRFQALLRRARADPGSMGFNSAAEVETALREARGLLFNTRRIAVSEINTAYTEAQRVSSVESPVVGDVSWTLSGRHLTLPSTPDICDTLATRDLYGLGKGRYPAEVVPSSPHPLCGCSRRPNIRPIEEWDQPKPRPRKPRSVSWEDIRRDYGRKKDGSWVLSELRARKLAARFNEQTGTAYRIWRDGDGALGPVTPPKPKPTRGPGAKKDRAPEPRGEAQKATPESLLPKVTDGNLFINPDGSWKSGKEVAQILISDSNDVALARVQLRNLTKAIEEQWALLKERNDKYMAVLEELYQLEDKYKSTDKGASKLARVRYKEDGILYPDYRAREEAFFSEEIKGYSEALVKRNEARARATAAKDTMDELTKKKDLANVRANQGGDRYREMLKFQRPARISEKFKDMAPHYSGRLPKLSGDMKAQISYEVQDWAEVVGEGLVDGKTVFFDDKLYSRAFHSPNWFVDGKNLSSDYLDYLYGASKTRPPINDYIGWSQGKGVAYHELGHWMESNNREYFTTIREYLEKRTKGARLRKMNDILSVTAYRDDEVSFDVQNSLMDPCVWKNYQLNGRTFGTELTSMVLQDWFLSPAVMARKDKDLFAFIYDTLRGAKR